MAQAKPEVEWFYFPNTYWKEYGLIGLAGKWAVVKAKGFHFGDDYEQVSEWTERATAIGFLKLLREKN